jgi:hypothetical protein
MVPSPAIASRLGSDPESFPGTRVPGYRMSLLRSYDKCGSGPPIGRLALALFHLALPFYRLALPLGHLALPLHHLASSFFRLVVSLHNPDVISHQLAQADFSWLRLSLAKPFSSWFTVHPGWR